MHGCEGIVLIFFHQANRILHDLINALYDGIRWQPSILFGKIHGSSGKMHPGAEYFCCLPLCRQQVTAVFRKDIMMVKDGRTAVLHQFADSDKRGEADGVFVQILPHLVQSGEPVEQLHVLNLRQVPREDLVEMMVRVHQPRVAKHACSIDHRVIFRFGCVAFWHMAGRVA